MAQPRQKQILNSDSYDDTLASGVGLQPTPLTSTVNVDLNGIRSQINKIIHGAAPTGSEFWYGSLSTAGVVDLATATRLCSTRLIEDVSVGSGVDGVVLDNSGPPNEVPSLNMAIGSVTTEGAVVAALPGAVGTFSTSAVVPGDAGVAIQPKNLITLIDMATGEVYTEGGKQVFGLFQVASTAVDGDPFPSTATSAQISFVTINSGATGFDAATTTGAVTLQYVYNSRSEVQNLPEDCTVQPQFADQTAAVDVTLQNAYSNGPTLTTNGTTGNVTFTGSEDFVITTANLDVDTTSGILLDADAASNFTVDSADLTISTTTSGELDLTSAGLLDINAGANMDVDVAGTYDLTATSTFSIAGTGASSVTATGGDLSLSTATSGSALIDGADGVEINSAGGAIAIGNDADAQAINIGTGAAARAITIGNGTTTTSVNLDSGSGGITLDSTNGGADPLLTLTTTGTDGDQVEVFVSDIDPTAAAGVPAPVGSILHRDSGGAGTTGQMWIKTGAPDTAWEQVRTGTSGSDTLQTAYEAGNTIVTSGAFGALDVSGTEAISLDAGAASNFTVAGADLTLATTTSGDVDIDSDGSVDITAATSILLTGDAGTGAPVGITAGSSSAATGGGVAITGGDGGTLGAGGDLQFEAGSATTDGLGGNVVITAGDGGAATGNNGGNVLIDAGSETGALFANDGQIQIGVTTANSIFIGGNSFTGPSTPNRTELAGNITTVIGDSSLDLISRGSTAATATGPVTLQSGNITGGGTVSSGAVTVETGSTDTTGGTGGTGDLTLGSGVSTGSAASSGNVSLGSGTGEFTGDVDISTGVAGASAGTINITAGSGGNTTAIGLGGSINIIAGDSNGATSGVGGSVSIEAGDGSPGEAGNGDGAISIGTVNASRIEIGVDGGGNGIPETTFIGSTDSTTMFSEGNTTVRADGTLSLLSAFGGAAAEPINIIAGDGSASAGNNVNVTAGAGVGTDQDGGDFNITTGAATGTGTPGKIDVNADTGEDFPWLAFTNLGITAPVEFFTGQKNPSSAGQAAPLGSLFQRRDSLGTTGQLYIKTGTLDTDWGLVATSGTGSITLQEAYEGGNTITTSALEGDVTITGTEAVSIGSTGAQVQLSTTGANEIDITSGGALDLNASGPVTVDTSSTIGISSSAAEFTVSGVGNSLIETTTGNLTLTTVTSGDVDIISAGQVDIDGASLDVDVTGVASIVAGSTFDISGTGNSSVTSNSGNLLLTTVGSGDVDIVSAAAVDIDGASLDVDVTGTIDIASSGSGFSVSGNGNSDLNATAGNLSLNTFTSGNVDINSVDAVTIDAGAASNFTVAGGGLTLSTTTSGVIDITAADEFNLTGNGDSLVAATGGSLTLETITSGAMTVASVDALTVNTKDSATGNTSSAEFSSGDVTALTGSSGDVQINVGSTVDGDAGTLTIAGGDSTGANGGDVTIRGGNGGAGTGDIPGVLSLTGGNAGSGSDSDGGNINITAGLGDGTGDPGFVNIRTGSGASVTDSDPVLQLANQGTTGETVQMFTGSIAPGGTVTADPGSLFMRDDGVSTGEVYVSNGDGAGAAGTSWSRLATTNTAGAPQQEPFTPVGTITTDTVVATLASTPISNASVVVYLNGIQQDQGAGLDYTVSGTSITWLAGTGTAVDLDTSDGLVVTYES